MASSLPTRLANWTAFVNRACLEFRSRLLLPLLRVNDLVVCRAARQAALLGGKLQGIFAVEFGLADELLDAVGQTLRRICLGSRVGGSLRADPERDFAPPGPFAKGRGGFRGVSAAELFWTL